MTLNEVLPIILYILGSILLGILIVLGILFFKNYLTITKMNNRQPLS